MIKKKKSQVRVEEGDGGCCVCISRADRTWLTPEKSSVSPTRDCCSTGKLPMRPLEIKNVCVCVVVHMYKPMFYTYLNTQLLEECFFSSFYLCV